MNIVGFIKIILYLLGLFGILLLLFTVGGVVSFIIPPLTAETLDLEVTTEDTLPVTHKWVELPKGQYKTDIYLVFRPYRNFLGERQYKWVFPEGQNFANFSISTSNASLYSWGYSKWTLNDENGEHTFNFQLNASENITLTFSFTQEDFDVEFEAQWCIVTTEVDLIKSIATDLRNKFLRRLVFGCIFTFVGFYLPERIE
ncbi:MAG: hypothetical protein ACFE8J_08805 [Candidatus Heimdallarchaeota archaeon]